MSFCGIESSCDDFFLLIERGVDLKYVDSIPAYTFCLYKNSSCSVSWISCLSFTVLSILCFLYLKVAAIQNCLKLFLFVFGWELCALKLLNRF